MKTIELDLEYINNLITLIYKIRYSSKLKPFMAPYNKVVVAGGAIRDMLFNKPVNDIDMFYEGEINESMFKSYFPNATTSDTTYPDGWNVTHNIMCDSFPVKVQLIQVENIEKHLETFPSRMMRLYVDGNGVHGVNSTVIQDALTKTFFWDQVVDLSYFLKIKSKYSDWKHEFMEKHFNPESKLEAVDLEFLMSVYFCSDLHFGHKNIQKFRQFVLSQNHNEQFICEAWKNKVTKRDDVYVLGDAAFTMEAIDLFKDLPGRKFLIRGNHDLCDTAAYLKVFAEVYGLFKYKEFWLSHAPIHPDELRGKVNLHGHVHYTSIPDGRYFNCCVENLVATFQSPLVELDQLRKLLAKRSNN